MIKVIIADDEVKVCQLIFGLIDWKSMDMEVVGIANNGLETLELIRKLKPDIVITDIRMPGYDGLEVIKQGKQINKNIDFIIISGYGNFEYAQSAIKYGVSDYLLKPINKKELITTLNNIRKKHKQKTEHNTVQEQLRLSLQNNAEKLRSSFLNDLLEDVVNQINFNIDEVNKNYYFHFCPGIFEVLVVKLDYEHNESYGNIQILKQKISHILREKLISDCFDMEIYLKNSRVYCMLNYGEQNKKNIRKKLKCSLDEILVQKNLFCTKEVTIGRGEAVNDICQIKHSLKTAEWAIKQRLVEGTGKILEGFQPKVYSDLKVLFGDTIKKLETSLEILDKDGVVREIDFLRHQVLRKTNVFGQEVFNLVIDIFSLFLRSIRNFQFDVDKIEDSNSTFYLRADLCSSVWELFICLSESISKIIDVIIKEKIQADIKPILMAKEYIHQNYMHRITLKEVSEFVGFNESYFSALFKKESGKNFTEYLSEIRINKAKELLKETNLSTIDICQTVGYNDLKHFTKTFKRLTGLKPHEYRKLYA
ncbi:response regulator [Tepidanaerobacter sp. GT38]|uniref:response regulator transcription factor n=1 Tax=Tepidanaerobacter sp. GT38 TaxID=2722793 RepID=UPI001F0259E1|nr:response regulator [Tepidanaerobacter sp. GT38]MCG1012518.1 response regulator [Tepidanaerobacter sp. GT38]